MIEPVDVTKNSLLLDNIISAALKGLDIYESFKVGTIFLAENKIVFMHKEKKALIFSIHFKSAFHSSGEIYLNGNLFCSFDIEQDYNDHFSTDEIICNFHNDEKSIYQLLINDIL